jgi:tetratricopeptide (TPR) repeat protein
LDAIRNDPRYLPPYINLAYLYQRLGQPEKAAQYFKKRFELGDPRDPWAQKAKDELIKVDPRYQEWVASLEAVSLNRQLEAKSHDEFYQRVKRSQEHFQRGDKYFKEKEYDKSVEEYDQALYFAPDNPKIIDARKMALLEIAKKSVKEQSEHALRRLEAGDTLSARHEIQKMLTTIPNEPMLVSPQYTRE